MTEETVNVTAPKLTGADRRIALHAIAACVKGNPAEVGVQILAGIATLDGDFNNPFVMLWPGDIYGYPCVDKRAEWYASELSHLQERDGRWEAARTRRSTDQSTQNQESETASPEEGLPQRNPPLGLNLSIHAQCNWTLVSAGNRLRLAVERLGKTEDQLPCEVTAARCLPVVRVCIRLLVFNTDNRWIGHPPGRT